MLATFQLLPPFLTRLCGSSIQGPVTKSGLWGGNEGGERDIKEVPRRLESVTIRSGHAIDSIAFSYTDQYGQSRTEGPWGGAGGTDHSPLVFPSLIYAWSIV